MVGFFIVLLSSLAFCFQNVIVRVLFNSYPIFGVVQTGGFVPPTLYNSFLLMAMRMVVVVPLMGMLATQLYPSTWKELADLRRGERRSLLLQSLTCGLLMFLYLALLYISIGLIPTGVALTLFFTYPAFTTLFSWKVFGDRPTLLRWSVMGLVFLGSFLTLPHTSLSLDTSYGVGVITGLASGVTYACYTILAQKIFTTLHPVPFTWLSFATTLVLSGISLFLWHRPDPSLPWTALWIGGLLSAIATFTGHLLNNLGIRRIGAATASMIAASNPALTVVLAWLTIQETLGGIQIMGVAIATSGVTLLGRERLKS